MSDAVLATDLRGRSLLEASAGTGKTYALAGLFARAVIVDRLRVPQVLAVTYTIAATQELHARVRARLQRAAELAAQWSEGDLETCAGDQPDTALLRLLLHTALHTDVCEGGRESLPALRLRLRRAVREMDLAAITTIHGFCKRLLAEHALDADQPLLATELQPDNRASRRALAVELWREFSTDALGSDFLRRAFGDIQGLADVMVQLVAPEELLPPPPATLPDDPRPAREAAWQALRAAFETHGDEARAAVLAAIAGKTLSNAQYKPDHVAGVWAWLAQCSRATRTPTQWHAKCAKYTPDALLAGTSVKRAGHTPRSPLFDAMGAMLTADAALLPWREAVDLTLLHRLRGAARARDQARKQAFNVRGFDDLVAGVYEALLTPEVRERLVAALQAQFPLMLVDEFQDTDARQWAIFDQLSQHGGLVLVGDPKQAIYRFRGGDVHAYLRARHGVGAASQLDRNFRSRPGVVAVVNALFADMPAEAMGAGIDVVPIHAAKSDDNTLLVDRAPAPALTFHSVPQRADGEGGWRDHKAAESVEVAAALCARAIRDALQAAAEGRATRRDANGVQRALEPRDCAVLVRRHNEAQAVRDALATLGVPAVATGRQSLFSSEAAQELLTLLLALAAPGDERRLRATLALPLFGLDASALRALEDDGEQLRRWQLQFEHWRLRWQQHGPQAMLADVVAQRAATVLALHDGERRLTHLLQLGELMQEARAARLGMHGQLDWLRAAIDSADDADEAQWPRLESDASRVQILTLHKSKGLEFPLVFLPFVGIGRGGGNSSDFVSYHDTDGERVRQWKTELAHDALPWKAASQLAAQEEREEDMRLLYVGLTRAIEALWVCGGALASHDKSALSRLLRGNVPGAALRWALDGLLQVRSGLPDPDDTTRLYLQDAVVAPPAREPLRRLHRDWWIHSFSQLHRQRPHGMQALVEETPASDERPLAVAVETPRDLRFSGERFGNVLHHALEHTDFAAWRDHAGEAPPPGQDDVLRRALQSQDYRDSDFADGVRALTPLVAATLNAPLPEGMRLCDVPPAQRIAELEFHFTLDDASAMALLALLHAHGIARERRDFGAWPRLSGLMTGKIDLTYRVDGRVHVIDYKSNYLSDYDATTLQQAMAASEYDLQALLYAVAVHRWLRLRLGDAYDFDAHFGGVRYLFCRGLDREAPARGVVVPTLPRALVEAVDELLAPAGGRA
ncbi:exodeoxyribonuclease V subunit beta [Lysobacter sp. CFH 32150]|uniref:UvrD-helicase domain-containing protein n=1 Tax=Lysobacter sp. CFH 32150 TaxID=2927128 RepID=UPI001FA7A704|nr:exodeoxyribonuclease V subunit beta [Lysobacter sp. CFH 32150]MCI4568050.1 exodeoxyribonuclease V subunit beta [Lysobacter sp. CFH 32150]